MKVTISNTKEATLLFVGDLLIFLAALWITLAVRYGEFPDSSLFMLHLVPFSFLFALWIVVFFVAGLYDKHTRLFKEHLPSTIFYAQLANILLAALFFFFIPYFGITPKTNLVIYLFVSCILVGLWRLRLFDVLVLRFSGETRQKAILIGSGKEIEEMKLEVNHNHRYPFEFSYHFDPAELESSLDMQGKLLELVSSGDATVIVGDPHSPALTTLVPLLSNLAFLEARFRFIDSTVLYESIFDRVPLSLIRTSWFLVNVSTSPTYIYDFFKRAMDIVAGFTLTIVTSVFFWVVAVLIKLDDKGPIFFVAERVGRDNKPFKLLKFRSMSITEKEQVTRVGKWLRRLRIDELPQSWNLLRGDISLIGPRPEMPRLVQQYAERILNYNVRHLIKPGISGWAQIKEYDVPRQGVVDTERTAKKLSYDLYYIKHRSLMLDVHVALKTLKTLLSRSGT